MMDRTLKRAIGVVCAGLTLASTPVIGQNSNGDATLKRLAALEAAQRAIRKELAEIKALLRATSQQPEPAFDRLTGVETTLDDLPVRGREAAEVVLIEFSDFQCPYCAQYARETSEQILREYVSSGRIQYAVRNFPIESAHPFAFKAAEAAQCARRQSRYWEFQDLLFAHSNALAPSQLATYAGDIGINVNEFQSCLVGAQAAHVRRDIAEGMRLGVTSTPTFLIGKSRTGGNVQLAFRITGAQPYATFRAALQEALEGR